MFNGRQRFCYAELLEFMKDHGEEAIHDYGELNVKIDLGQKLKVQDRINELKNSEKDDYDKNKIQGIDFGNLDIDPKDIVYDPALKRWDDLDEDEKDRLRGLYPHLFGPDGEFIYNHNIPPWMKFGPPGAKYDKYGIVNDEDSSELSSLASDEEYYIDENGKRRKRKKRGDDLDGDDADDKNMRLDDENRLEEMFQNAENRDDDF